MAQIKIPRVKILLNERPKGMSYTEYRERLKAQKKFLHGYKDPETGAHMMGRLEGVLIPSSKYKNSAEPRVVIG